MEESQDLKIALVHDFLIQYGGAEKVLETFCEMFPKAPIYTILYDKEKIKGKFADKKIVASFFQKFPKFLRKRYKYFLPLLPTAPETFDLREYNLVISSSGAWSKGIITRLNTIHIAYIHSPMRFVWDYNEEYLREEKKEKLSFLIRPILSYFRLWDKLAADRPDYLIANSKYTQERIKKYYGRESKIIYPPVEIKSQIPNSKFQIQNSKQPTIYNLQPTSYFLIVSRLSAYKKIDKAIEAFNKLELPLAIIGEGKEEKELKKIAGKNIKFLGWQPENELAGIYAGARAFISPGLDDFGIALVEAMAQAVPVIALKKGGAIEIVEEGRTGEFFAVSEPEIIADAVRRFCEKEKEYDRDYIRQCAYKFNEKRFADEFGNYIKTIMPNVK